MSLRKVGRWLYHVVTSSEKRPYIDLTLPALGEEVTRASTHKEVFKLLGVFDELTYRITSAPQRDLLKKRISELILRFEHEKLSPESTRDEVAGLRTFLLKKYAEAATTEAQALRDAEEKAKREAEQEKARLAAAAVAKKEAEAKARREAAEEAKREKERLAAEEKARQAAEVERARLEAEAQALRDAEEKAKREAEQEKARLAAAAAVAKKETEARRMASAGKSLTFVPPRLQDKAEKKRLEEEARRQDLEEQIRKFNEARPIPEPEIAIPGNNSKAEQKELPQSKAETILLAEQVTHAKEVGEALLEVEVKEYEHEEVEAIAAEEIKDSSAQDDQVDSVDKGYASSARQLQELPEKTYTGSFNREEQREERRELARLRKLERDERVEDQSGAEELESVEEYDFEEAEQFAQYLRLVPSNWSSWSEQDWNIKLLHYCFVQKANEGRSQGIPSTEEDLVFITGDRESRPIAIAQALVDRVREFSLNHGLSPARLLIKRLETWDHKSSAPPRFFAFLWTTCLIAQGFPSPFEQGEFHRRYERDDVYGANERQYLSRNLPAAWIQLSKWLDRNDIFDGQGHRQLVLPQTDPSRSIISHSWKLSFPCRADRKRLYDVLRRAKKDHWSNEFISRQLISRIYHEGGFTPEFNVALKQQIELLEKEGQAEEWLTAIIQREVGGLGENQSQLRRQGEQKPPTSRSPRIELYLDDEDCYLELVLPSQLVPIKKTSRLAQEECCIISLENEATNPLILCELDINPDQEELLIPELRKKIELESEEYTLRLNHKEHDNAVIAEWTCGGLTSDKPFFLIESETNEIINIDAITGSSLSLLYRNNWDVVTSNGIEAQDSIRVSKLSNWRLLLLTKNGRLEDRETICFTNDSGQEFAVSWVDSDEERRNGKPVLKGLSLPAQANKFVMLADSPELWLPPEATDAQIEVFRIKEDEFFLSIGSIQALSPGIWQQIGLRKFITRPGHYSVKISYVDSLRQKHRKWSRQVLVTDDLDTRALAPKLLQAVYSHKETSKTLDLEKNVSPLVFNETHEFWNSNWRIFGLWPNEQIRVDLAGEAGEYSVLQSADNTGICELNMAAFEPYLVSRYSVRFSIKRKGFGCHYNLANIEVVTINAEEPVIDAPIETPVQQNVRSVRRRRLVDRLDLIVYGDRGSFDAQRMLVDGFRDIMEEQFGHLDGRSSEHPEGKYARGNRFVFYRVGFDDIDNDIREELSAETDLLVSSMRDNSGLAFSAEWSKARE